MMKKQILFLVALTSLIFSFAQENADTPFYEELPSFHVFTNKSAKLLIHKKKYRLEMLDAQGNVRYSEYRSPVFELNRSYISISEEGVLKYVSENAVEMAFPANNGMEIRLSVEKAGSFGFKLRYTLPEAEVSNIQGIIRLEMVEEIYGFGENWNGELAQRGEVIEIWDKGGTPDECAWMPYFVSTNNYAFFLAYGGKVRFDIGQRKADELVYELLAGELEYTILLGKNIASTVQNFAQLTGLPAKPPRWTFEPWFWLMTDPEIPGGNISTLKGEHFLEMTKKLKELNIPIGVTWFEPPWQDARTTFIPDKEFSSDLKKLIADLIEQGVKTLAWTVPYTSPGASNWEEAVRNSYLVRKPGGKTDNSQITISRTGELEGTFYNKIDFFNPDAVNWWQAQIEESVDLGLKGFKLDAGQGLPSDGLLYGGRIGKDVHNSYALEYNRVFYESLKRKLGNDFLVIPRAAWIGSGAYTNFKWPGDLSGSFANNGLPSSVYSSLSLAFCGIPFVSTDIGGFVDRPAPEDVWIRWAQFGSMLPGMQTLHMPWWYSREAEAHFRFLAWLHTDLIPYWETLANEAHETGTPICRPLIWNYQNDQNTWYVDDEFTVGDYLLVAPFMNPDRMRDVYLPEGRWFDFWNDELLEGKQKVRWFKGWQESLYRFPLYVKEGAVIPMEVKNDITGFGSKHSEGLITLAMWPEKGAETEFILNDREGPVSVTTNWTDADEIRVSWGRSEKDYLFRLHLQGQRVPERLFAGNGELSRLADLTAFQENAADSWFFDPKAQKLWVKKFHDIDSGNVRITLKRIK
ncbi:MAG: glycoside hydrolase family 31 protein [Mangrovibacterium sp.]|nr:glycoside hydrolase family 31 protein [Mangrovibacterium sp.]